MKMLKPTEVEKALAISKWTLQRLRADGGFPKPIQVNERTIRWHESEILEWLEARRKRF